jgi:RND family efflux transporter MFP subunit
MLLVALTGPATVLAQDYPFPVAEARHEAAPRERIWDGTVEAVNEATVSAQTSGRITEILVDVNDFVDAGALIMKLTDSEQKAALRRAEAALQEAQARSQEAETEFTRISGMYDNQTVSRARFEQASANRDAANARLDSARAGVSSARDQLDYCMVKAPYAGIVSKRHVEVGESVVPGKPLMSGLSLQAVRVKVDVPQSMVDPIRNIGKAFVYTADERIEGASLTFFPVADPATNTFRIRVNLPENRTVLYPGMFVKVGFIVGQTNRLLVPSEAIVQRSELTAIYVVDGQGGVGLRQLRTGRRFDDRVEVLAGLEGGERVALDPVRAGIYLKEHLPRVAEDNGH